MKTRDLVVLKRSGYSLESSLEVIQTRVYMVTRVNIKRQQVTLKGVPCWLPLRDFEPA